MCVHKRVHGETLPHGAVLLWLTISPSGLLKGGGKESIKWRGGGGGCVFLLNKARSLLFPSTCRAQTLKSVDVLGEKECDSFSLRAHAALRALRLLCARLSFGISSQRPCEYAGICRNRRAVRDAPDNNDRKLTVCRRRSHWKQRSLAVTPRGGWGKGGGGRT